MRKWNRWPERGRCALQNWSGEKPWEKVEWKWDWTVVQNVNLFKWAVGIILHFTVDTERVGKPLVFTAENKILQDFAWWLWLNGRRLDRTQLKRATRDHVSVIPVRPHNESDTWTAFCLIGIVFNCAEWTLSLANSSSTSFNCQFRTSPFLSQLIPLPHPYLFFFFLELGAPLCPISLFLLFIWLKFYFIAHALSCLM